MGANGQVLGTCLANYIDALESTGIKVDINPDDVVDAVKTDTETDAESDNNQAEQTTTAVDTADEPGTVTGTVVEIRTAVKNGDSYYYIKLDKGDVYYSISASKSEDAVILDKGDTVTIKYSGSGKILTADALTIK